MTHDSVDRSAPISLGSQTATRHTINITALDGANYENYDPSAESGVNRPDGVVVLGQENAGFSVAYDHVNDRLHVTNADGTDPTAGTAVGEVVLRVVGT